MKEALTDIEQKKFSEFSKKVKTSLEDKLRNNPTIKAKGEELKNLSKMKDTFASIKKSSDEPQINHEPTEPTTHEE
jgi:hypothetical protein